MEKVSVLLPNYNNAKYLKEALDSIFNQSYQNFVIYFIDDCSTDNSVEIAESFNDDRLKILVKEKNSGIVDTMNIGLDLIDTKYYIRMDGDDISDPDRFKILMEFMDENMDIGVCSSAIRVFGKNEETLVYSGDSEYLNAHLIFGHALGHASSIFRTEVIKQNGIRYKNDFWRMEDYHLFYDLRNLTKTTGIPNVLYHYRKEHYNSNKEIEEKKKDVFRNFYQMVFQDLRMPFSPEEIELHLQFSLRSEPTYQFKHYNGHAKKILAYNSQSNVFPQKKMKYVLNYFLDLLTYRLIDKKAIGLGDVLLLGLRKPAMLKYYFSKKYRS